MCGTSLNKISQIVVKSGDFHPMGSESVKHIEKSHSTKQTNKERNKQTNKQNHTFRNHGKIHLEQTNTETCNPFFFQTEFCSVHVFPPVISHLDLLLQDGELSLGQINMEPYIVGTTIFPS